MSGLAHSAKLAIAKRLRTHDELIRKVPLFETAGWERRKARVRRKVIKQEAIAKYHAARRKQETSLNHD